MQSYIFENEKQVWQLLSRNIRSGLMKNKFDSCCHAILGLDWWKKSLTAVVTQYWDWTDEKQVWQFCCHAILGLDLPYTCHDVFPSKVNSPPWILFFLSVCAWFLVVVRLEVFVHSSATKSVVGSTWLCCCLLESEIFTKYITMNYLGTLWL